MSLEVGDHNHAIGGNDVCRNFHREEVFSIHLDLFGVCSPETVGDDDRTFGYRITEPVGECGLNVIYGILALPDTGYSYRSGTILHLRSLPGAQWLRHAGC
ncbi:MAG TPA: hypothetical protein O0X23_01010 [Methanocorpusculum sp.]|nr:hypothetical protein [Methanocorpusculum sp.]